MEGAPRTSSWGNAWLRPEVQKAAPVTAFGGKTDLKNITKRKTLDENILPGQRCSLTRKEPNARLLRRQSRNISRGSPRFLTAQTMLVRNDNWTLPSGNIRRDSLLRAARRNIV